MKICYHGTDENSARCILQNGFFPDCWFATHLESAIIFGGSHVFEVAFDNPPENWQFHVPNKIGPGRIIRYRRFQITTIFESQVLRRKIQDSTKEKSHENRSFRVQKGCR